MGVARKGTPFPRLQFIALSVPPPQIVIMLGKGTQPVTWAEPECTVPTLLTSHFNHWTSQAHAGGGTKRTGVQWAHGLPKKNLDCEPLAIQIIPPCVQCFYRVKLQFCYKISRTLSIYQLVI